MNENDDKSILEILSDVLGNERLDKIILENEEYIKTQVRIDEATAEYKRLCLPDEERLIIDRLMSAYSASGAFYAGMAYQQGAKDCASLFRELKLV